MSSTDYHLLLPASLTNREQDSVLKLTNKWPSTFGAVERESRSRETLNIIQPAILSNFGARHLLHSADFIFSTHDLKVRVSLSFFNRDRDALDAESQTGALGLAARQCRERRERRRRGRDLVRERRGLRRLDVLRRRREGRGAREEEG